MSSALNTALSVGNIIGIVVGIISAIATIICCIIFMCYCCKNKNRSNVWSDQPPDYYYDNRAYGRANNPPNYYQRPTTVTTSTVAEKY